jgi:hypothetical protein
MNRREEYEKTQTAVTREEAQQAWNRLGAIDRDHWVIWNGELTTDPRYREERERCYRIVEAYIYLRPHPDKEPRP